MRYALLIVAAGLKKACKTKSLLTHMSFFSLWPWIVNHIDYVSPCLVYTFKFIFVCVHVAAAPLAAMLISMPLTRSSRLLLVYVSVNGSSGVRVWGWEAKQREDWLCVSVWICGVDKILKPGAQRPSILAGDWRHWRGRVAAAAAQPTILPIPLSHSLLETGLFHSLLALIYTFCKALNNAGSWHYACFGTGRM